MCMRRKILLYCAMIGVIVLSGCFQGENSLEGMDEPRDANLVDELDDMDGHVNENNENDETDSNEEETPESTVERELYLIDVNGMVVSQTLELPIPESKEVATQVLEYLVKGGPVTDILPNGFQAVLPNGTEVLSLNLQEDGTLTVDLSEEFTDYEAEEEVKILEAMTFTLTQFENIDRIKLQINGHPLSEMPVDGTPIGEGYSRANGINYVQTNTIDFIASSPVTMYYPAEYNDNRYYVPITQHIKDDMDNVYSAIVNALITGPRYNVNVMDVFNAQTELTEAPTISDGVLHLVFNEEILKDIEKSMISDEVMETLTRTLTGEQSVKAIKVEVENISSLVNEEGKVYEEPVTIDIFKPSEKM